MRDIILLVPQAIDRVTSRRFEGLRPYREQRDEQYQQTGKGKHPPLNTDAVREICQPLLHKIISDRNRQRKAQQHKQHEIFREQE